MYQTSVQQSLFNFYPIGLHFNISFFNKQPRPRGGSFNHLSHGIVWDACPLLISSFKIGLLRTASDNLIPQKNVYGHL